jgi:hypothetical protein
MAETHVSVYVPTPTPVWDPEQQRMVPFPQLPTSAVNSTWLQQHVPCPAKGQLMTSLLLAQRVPVQRVPPVQTSRRHGQRWRHGSPSVRPFLRGRLGSISAATAAGADQTGQARHCDTP